MSGRDSLPLRGPTPCLPDEILAGWAEGRLPAASLDEVEMHLSTCAACRDLVTELTADVERLPALEHAGASAVAAPARAARVLVLRLRVLALAAALVVAVGASLYLATRGPAPVALDDDGRLVALAADLGRERPDLFEGFSPLSPAERRARVERTRGGLAVFEPSGLAEGPRPETRWAPVRGVSGYRVVVRRADGLEVLHHDATATTFAYPADAPTLERGVEYEVEVAADGPAGAVSGSAGFRIVTEAEDAAFRDAAALVATRAPAGLGALARAHLAARRGWWAEAEASVRAFLAEHPSDRDGAELLAHVLDRRGGAAEAPPSR